MKKPEPTQDLAWQAWQGDVAAARQMTEWVADALMSGAPISQGTRYWLAAVLGSVLDANSPASERAALDLLGQQRRGVGTPKKLDAELRAHQLANAVNYLTRCTKKSHAVADISAAMGIDEKTVWNACGTAQQRREEMGWGESQKSDELLQGFPVLRAVWEAAQADRTSYCKELYEFLAVTFWE